MSSAAAVRLVEVFSSVQGEGPHVGRSTVFVRLGECDLRCLWCDSPHTWKAPAQARLQVARGSERFESIANPVPVARVLEAADALGVADHHFASLTGGEPLLQPDAVAALARGLRERGTRVLLETHGLAADALAGVVDHVDVVSMDWKLASDVRRASDPKSGPVREFHDEHEAFLAVARRAPEVVVKLVVTPASGDAELEEAWARIARADPTLPVILQPVTPCGGVDAAPAAARLLELEERASRTLRDVRVIPQTHPVLGAR